MDVSTKDGLPGCPEIVWDGPYRYRCSIGTTRCHIHGRFETKKVDATQDEEE